MDLIARKKNKSKSSDVNLISRKKKNKRKTEEHKELLIEIGFQLVKQLNSSKMDIHKTTN